MLTLAGVADFSGYGGSADLALDIYLGTPYRAAAGHLAGSARIGALVSGR